MTIFMDQDDLLKMLRNKLSIPNDVELKVSIKLGKNKNEYLWIETYGEFEFDSDRYIKKEKGEE